MALQFTSPLMQTPQTTPVGGGWEPSGEPGMVYGGGGPSYNPTTGQYRQFDERTGEYNYWSGEGGLSGGMESIAPKTPYQGPTPEGDPQWQAGILPGGQPAAGYGSPAWEAAQGGVEQGGGMVAQGVSQELAQSQTAQTQQQPYQPMYGQQATMRSYQPQPMYSPYGGFGSYGGGYGSYSPYSPYGGGYSAPQQNLYGGGYGGYGGGYGGYGGYSPYSGYGGGGYGGGGYIPQPAPPMGGYYGGYGMGGGGYGGDYSSMTGLSNLLGSLGGLFGGK